MSPSSLLRAAGLLAAAAPMSLLAAQQTDVSVAPFITFLPAGGASPLAGLALTMAGNGQLALRASGHVQLQNSNSYSLNNGVTYHPWGADADAVLFLGGRAFAGSRRVMAPYVFAGVGTAASDSLGRTAYHNNWSYGAGLTVPLFGAVDLFGESRWRMSRFVLPSAQLAPRPTNELRIGLTFHLANGSSASRSEPRARDRRASLPSSLPASRYPASPAASATAQRVLATASDYLGTPYRWGGTSPSSGFDCSGFTQYVFARQGVQLPRTSREQAQVGAALSPEWRALSPGDLVMFAEGDRIDHVAIYAGHNRIIHSSSSGGGVRYDDLSTQRGEWFVDHMVAARRVTPDASGLLLDLARGFSELGIQLDGPDHAPRP